MTEEQIGNILRVIGTANVSEEQRGSTTADVLQLAAETFTKQVFTSLLNAKPNEIKREEEKAPQQRGRQKTGIRFTKQEMKKMPLKYRKIFAHEDIIVPYRLRKDGVYEARVRRKDLHIEVSARNFAALKEKIYPRTAQRGRTSARGDQRSKGYKLRRIHPAMARSETSARQAFDVQRVR